MPATAAIIIAVAIRPMILSIPENDELFHDVSVGADKHHHFHDRGLTLPR
jgi:hypothetical protein